jgi:hypothetical protein
MRFPAFLGLSPNPFSNLTAGRSRGVMRQIGTTRGQIVTTFGAGGPHAIFSGFAAGCEAGLSPAGSCSLLFGAPPRCLLAPTI